MKSIITLTLLTASMALISGCAATQPALAGQTDSFGKSVAHNIAEQAIAPSDAQKANTHIPANPKRRAAARERYENGETLALQTAETTN